DELKEKLGQPNEEIQVRIAELENSLKTKAIEIANSNREIERLNAIISEQASKIDSLSNVTEGNKSQMEDYKEDNGGIIFPNPNAPTGILEPLSFVEEIVRENPESIVIIDEAYIDFGGESAIPLLEKYDNLLVVQTFSKSRSMAGMRIGYAIGSSVLIGAMQDVKYSYNSYTMSEVSIRLGNASIEDQEYFEQTIQKIIATREWFCNEIKQLGFEFLESKTNFVFATHKKYDAKKLFEAARKENIYMRYFEKPRIDQYLRITIGTKEQMEALVSFFKKFIDREEGRF
ncbi:MAG: aminotransferase class I/II-fold pyridoxal phosphate-dependent enzyme, partial [Clostridiales bacterium]|nr:aminotransferase class I/II-fold pyridoxal phosphate-dependent enzyme [Clostridiales bacterium]